MIKYKVYLLTLIFIPLISSAKKIKVVKKANKSKQASITLRPVFSKGEGVITLTPVIKPVVKDLSPALPVQNVVQPTQQPSVNNSVGQGQAGQSSPGTVQSPTAPTTSPPQAPPASQTTQPQPATQQKTPQISQAGINQFCPFVSSFKTIPRFPTNVPSNVTDLTNYVAEFSEAVNNVNAFIKNYSGQVNNWQANNELQAFVNLIKTLMHNQKDYNNAMNAQKTCVANAPVPSGNTIQSGCSAELINYTKALNTMYDSMANVLTFLAKYNFAPSWASPIVRLQTPAYYTNSQNQPVGITVSGQALQINTIRDFDNQSFSDQITACQNYLQTQLQNCYTEISQVSGEINNLSTVINNTQNTIQKTAESLQESALQSAQEEAAITSLVGLSLGVLTAPEFTVLGAFVNSLAQKEGGMALQVSNYMNNISAQIEKQLVSDWGAVNLTSAQGVLNLVKGMGDVVELLGVGMAGFAMTFVADMQAIISDPLGSPGATLGAIGSMEQSFNPYSMAGIEGVDF